VTDDELDALLAEITRRIRAVSDPEQIILFGSYARGEAGPDSDLDVLVIERDVAAPRQASTALRRALRGLGTPIDVIVASSTDVARYRNVLGLLYHPALHEGKVLYDRSARAGRS
jgi:predicted nucleotidyltransferase